MAFWSLLTGILDTCSPKIGFCKLSKPPWEPKIANLAPKVANLVPEKANLAADITNLAPKTANVVANIANLASKMTAKCIPNTSWQRASAANEN